MRIMSPLGELQSYVWTTLAYVSTMGSIIGYCVQFEYTKSEENAMELTQQCIRDLLRQIGLCG